jgi:hypothetical protein
MDDTSRIYRPGKKGWQMPLYMGGRVLGIAKADVSQEPAQKPLKRPPPFKRPSSKTFDPYNTSRHDKKKNRWRG